jgi:hypothetical protein
MWGDSWINLSLKLQDMPYYKGMKEKKEDEIQGKRGTVDDLRNKFSKYIK